MNTYDASDKAFIDKLMNTPFSSTYFNFLGNVEDLPEDAENGAIVIAGDKTFVYREPQGWFEVLGVDEDVSASKFETESKFKRKVPVHQHCQSCGAPVDTSKETCPYCDVPYIYN